MKTRLFLLPLLLFAVIGLAAEPAKKPTTETKIPDQKTAEAKATDKPADKDARVLFDGKTLGDWKICDELGFKDHGKIDVADGAIRIGLGDPYSGIVYGGKFPKINYEIALEAKRTKGDDFFCGLTFPVDDSPLTLIVGGWGGTVVGFSNIDGMNASENSETHGKSFDNDRWYKIRLRVATDNISLFIDDEHLIDLDTKDHKFDIYSSLDLMKPLGVTTWNTGSSLRNITVKTLPAKTEKKTDEKPKTDKK